MTDIMTDIETMGTQGNRQPILTIGACRFDWDTGVNEQDTFYMGATLRMNEDVGRLPQADTVDWWMRQEPVAQASLFEAPMAESLEDLITLYGDWVTEHKSKWGKVWAKPPSFDLDILEECFKQFDVDIPWHWGMRRDVRAFVDMAKRFNMSDVLQTSVPEIKHRADHDAITQAKLVVGVNSWVKCLVPKK